MLLEKLVHTFIIGLRHVKIESYLCLETLNTGVYTCIYKDKFELSGKLELKLKIFKFEMYAISTISLKCSNRIINRLY